MSESESTGGSMAMPILGALLAFGLLVVVLGGAGLFLFAGHDSSGPLRGGKRVAVAVSYDASPAREMGGVEHSTGLLSDGSGSGGGPADAGPAARKAKAEAKASVETRQRRPQSGQLTAGAWDDTLNPAWFDRFASGFAGQGAWAEAARRVGPRTVIHVRHPGGGLSSARVTVRAGGRRTRLMTGTDGRAILAATWDGLPTTGEATVIVESERLEAPVQATFALGQAAWTVDVPAPKAGPTRALDLALIVDATGSMGDEMRYLQAEIDDIISGVERRMGGNVDMRFALVVYRDQGDEYVTRRFEFTPDLASFRKHLAAQSANGGGDTPEAMDAAIGDAASLKWRKGDVARVAFLVADARPHARNVRSMLETVDAMRRRGVSIYPLAASGTDKQCELMMRISAVLTGAWYLFLTDDSGIGNPHAEPHIPAYHVQRLDRLMTRVIQCELSGTRIEADEADIVRSVGVMKAGVAAPPASLPRQDRAQGQ